MNVLGYDIGSNSVGSVWIDRAVGGITAGVSVFPAGVDESDDKRGDPKNAKRRMTRRTRITLARRSQRKRELRLKLIEAGLLPGTEAEFKTLLEATDPWELRRNGLDEPLMPFEFGRVLLHLAQRRGALGLHVPEPGEEEAADEAAAEDGKVKAAIGAVRTKMLERKARTFGEFIAMVRAERVTPITSKDARPEGRRKGPREWREAVRNKAASYEHCADRPMIRDEFARLWEAQRGFGGQTGKLLTPELRLALDDESGDAIWRHKGLLFGQRRQSWDLGTLGRCNLHPEERCVPHADMDASRYLVVETVNNLKIIERGKEARPLTPEERAKIKAFLSGPLGMEKGRKKKGDTGPPADRPKRTVSVTDLRNFMGTTKDGWGRASKASRFRFNIENDEDRAINTDWFSREIIHGAVSAERWAAMPERVREGLNRAILKFDPDQEEDAAKLRAGVMDWAGLSKAQADAFVAAWKTRPKPDAKRLSMSRRAVRNLLTVMDRAEPWPDPNRPGQTRWLTQIEARKLLAGDGDFKDQTTGEPFDDITRRRYATGAKGATARDRYYMGKHVLLRDGKPVIDRETGEPLAEPPPAPLIGNPVVRKAIHEVRRHLVEYMKTFGRKPDEVYIELAREAKMGKKDADRLLFRNRLRNRIRNNIIHELDLESQTSTQQRAAVDRVILCVQQGGVCPLCGRGGLTARLAATGGECEVAHIIPRASGGHNGLSNIVLSHTRCNREMGRRTPRQYWSDGAGFDQGLAWVEGIYGDVKRPKPSEVKSATGEPLWACYFNRRDDQAKVEQFKKDVKDIQEMTARQEAATKYAARQVMAYLADALYDGKGLPERGGERRIYATEGMWTSRLRREWGLFFDPHDARSHGLSGDEERERKEKNRGDHRHHAIDAAVIALCTRQVQIAWEDREKQADKDGINTADGEAMDNYRRQHPLGVPAPFESRDELRDAVRRAVFGDDGSARPICHRPVKRKLIGALHEETLFGPVLDRAGNLTGNYTAKKSVLALDRNHLRMPRPETETEAIERLAARRQRDKSIDERTARKWARAVVSSPGYKPAIADPPPGKSGIVRDVALRARLRECIEEAGLDPDDFSATEIKKLYEAGRIRHASGVPIHSVVLLRTMNDPVVINRKRPEYGTGRMLPDDDPASKRAYVGGNNHHIEIRINDEGALSGEIVSAYEAAQRKLARLRAFREARIPKPDEFRKLPKADRRKLTPVLRAIEQANPLVDRRDDDANGGRFLMSLCEGEMLWMKHKETGEVGYFVVAKLDKPRSIVVVPHWDARAATERKDAEGKKVPDSKREQFAVTPSDLEALAPPGREHAVKVRVSPLGVVTELERD
ncbi:MAG TPA: HNH endonuclease domain-containing protein [Phycisphaerales bacterium]|nr:HNH endonuclease domain-containing protein [Phycisphaerales bacterium]